MELFSGIRFKKEFPNKKFYKVTNKTETHYGLTYQTGINKDTNKFTTSKCSNGLYFTDKENLLSWIDVALGGWGCNGHFIREVSIMDDSIVCVEGNGKYKTDIFMLGERVEIFDSDVWNDSQFCIDSIKKDSKFAQKIEYKYKLIDMGLVKPDIDYYNKMSLEDKIKFVKNNPQKFPDLCDFTPELCDIAVSSLGSNIQHVGEQSNKQCWLALKSSTLNIRYIKRPTHDMIMYVIVSNPNNVVYISDEKITPEMKTISSYFMTSDNTPNISEIDCDIQNTSYNHNVVMRNIDSFVKETELACGEFNKKKVCIRMYDYLMNNLYYVKRYEKLKISVINKLKEFKNSGYFCNFEADYYLNKINDYCSD
jgi:hypothetical protein